MKEMFVLVVSVTMDHLNSNVGVHKCCTYIRVVFVLQKTIR